jgi:hypothetical protein
VERNPLYSLMMGLRGGGSTEGARAYPGGAGINQVINKGDPFSENIDWEAVSKANDEFMKKQFPADLTLGLDEELSQALSAKGFPAPGEAKTTEWWPSEWDTPQRQPFDIESVVQAHRAMPPLPEVVRAYHGTQEGPVGASITPYEANLREEFERETGQPLRNSVDLGPKFYEPHAHKTEKGVFFTSDPETASRYAGYDEKGADRGTWTGSKVFPVDLNMKNSVTVDLEKIAGKPLSYDPHIVSTAIDHARQNNKDFVVIKNMWDVGGKHDQIIAVRPAGNVKSAITGETMYAHPLSALLAAALAGGTVSRKLRADETTISPDMAR